MLICYGLKTAGQESLCWYLLFSSHLNMFPDEDEGERQRQKEAHWKYWDISKGRSIHFLQLPLIEVMDHHQVSPHLSLSDKGWPQSNIHTPRTHSYFSIPLHPRLPFFPILHSHVLRPRLKFFLLPIATFTPPLHPVLFLYRIDLRLDIYSLSCMSCTSFLPLSVCVYVCVRVCLLTLIGWLCHLWPSEWVYSHHASMDGSTAKTGELIVPSWHCRVEGLCDVCRSFQNHFLEMNERKNNNKRTGFMKVTEKLYSSFPVLLVD